ncbi:MAG TPA: RDD family protein [Caldimonas sp.]|nr:RDD family protein [Caldimonas sp.]
MSEAPAAAAMPGAAPTTPSIARRMACFVYEATLLFGLGLIPGVIGAVFVAQTGQHGVLQSPTALRIYAWILYGVYFVWFWTVRGQTLAMQTWRIGLVTAAGHLPTQARALTRYVACCIAWFGPSTAIAFALRLPPSTSLALAAAWIVVYALLARAAPGRQFWHDIACGTRLVDTRAIDWASLRSRPR